MDTQADTKTVSVDVGENIPENWVDGEGYRAFYLDAFLSHNRNDGSGKLQAALRARGVKAWHDGDADLADRGVREKILRALVAARTVVVFIGADFRDTP